MRVAPLLLPLLFLATPARAQFPPPGIYHCVDVDGMAVGDLTLLVAGDYSFTDTAGATGTGQVASAGSDVDPLSGPLAEMRLAGSFETSAEGKTVFVFSGPDDLALICR